MIQWLLDLFRRPQWRRKYITGPIVRVQVGEPDANQHNEDRYDHS